MTTNERNKETSRKEVLAWNTNPPENYFAYINEEKRLCTTWTGDMLGTVGFGKAYRNNMGDTRVPINVYATNGKTYHGTYFKSTGDYCRIKAKV